jgi:hypothetical protein
MNAYQYCAQLRITGKLSISQMLKMFRAHESERTRYTVVYMRSTRNRGSLVLMTMEYGASDYHRSKKAPTSKLEKDVAHTPFRLKTHRKRHDDGGSIPITDVDDPENVKTLILSHILFVETMKIIN